MAKKSKRKTKAPKQSYLPIVVLNNNVKPAKKKVSRKAPLRFSDLESGQFANGNKDTVVYIQNYPPPGVTFNGRIDESFERRSGSSSSGSAALQPYVSRSEHHSFQVPVLWIHSIPTCSMLKRYKSWCVFRSGLIFSISGSLAVDEQARTVTLHRAEVFEAPWWLITRSLARTSSHEDTSRDLLGPTIPIPRPGNNTVKLFLP